MNKMTGTVLEVKDGRRIRMMEDGEWYSAWNQQSVSAGDFITFAWKESTKMSASGKPYKNIVGNVVVQPAPSLGSQAPVQFSPSQPDDMSNKVGRHLTKFGEPVLTRDRCIIRQNAATTAARLMEVLSKVPTESFPDTAQDVVRITLDMAREIEKYTSGDGDLEAAKDELMQEDG